MKVAIRPLFVLLAIVPLFGIGHTLLSLIMLALHIDARAVYIGMDLVLIAVILVVMKMILKKDAGFDSGWIEGVRENTEENTGENIGETRHWNWPVILSVLSVIFCISILWSVRLDFEGSFFDGSIVRQTSADQHDQQMSRLSLPAFSDEWVISGYAQKTAEHRITPAFNPLDPMRPRIFNLLAPMVAGFAGLSIVTDINAMTGYWIYVFAFQLLFVIGFYLFLRACKLSPLACMAGLLMLIFLPEGNLLPGIWIMLPAYVSLIFLFFAYYLFAERSLESTKEGTNLRKVGIISNLVFACLLYPAFLPPMVVYGILYNLKNRRPDKSMYAKILALGVGTILLILIYIGAMGLALNSETLGSMMKVVWHAFVHPKLFGSTPSVWTYIPLIAYLMSVVGAYAWMRYEQVRLKEKALISFVFIGLLTLLAFSYTIGLEINLSHQRVVFMLWILMIMLASFSIDSILRTCLKQRVAEIRTRIILQISILIVQILLLSTVSYSGSVQFAGAVSREDVLREPIYARPSMSMMFPEDFIKKINSYIASYPTSSTPLRILASPYPNLAIGAATDLQPISTQDSFISVSGMTLEEFLSHEACDLKYYHAQKVRLTFVLLHESELSALSNCSEFISLGKIGGYYELFSVSY